ncbi:MAG: class I SAM-dependent methyltransferase [Verrucomicrobiota bacterium]
MASYQAVAPWYRLLEKSVFGGQLDEARRQGQALLTPARAPLHRLLVPGVGNGAGLQDLARGWKEVVVFDPSPGMLTRARKRLGDALSYLRLEELSTIEEPFDALLTCFVLDHFQPEEQQEAIGTWGERLRPGGWWVDVDFQPARRVAPGWSRWKARGLLALMLRFFQLTCGISAKRLHSPEDFFAQSGFTLETIWQSRDRFLRAHAWRLAPDA